MQTRTMSEQDFQHDIQAIQRKLIAIQRVITQINEDTTIQVDGIPQNVKAMLNALFPPHLNIDKTNLIEFWDDKDKLKQWETTLDKITRALLANDATSQLTLRKRKRDSGAAGVKPEPTTLDLIDAITTQAEKLRDDVKLLCTNYYGTAKETKDRRRTVLFDSTVAEKTRLENESELKFLARKINDGDPALEGLNDALSEENRKVALGIANNSIINNHFFKHEIYEKSIENMARAILKEDRDLFVGLNLSELKDIKTEATGAIIDLKGTCVDYSNHYNELSWRVVKDILQHKKANKDVAQIAFSIDYWINVAYELAFNPNLPDLHGTTAIIYGLHSGTLTRVMKLILTSKPSLINDKTKAKYEKLAALCDLSKDAKAPEEFISNHPNCIVPLALLQKKLEVADAKKESREPLLAQMEKKIIGAKSASITDTSYKPNIGEVGIKDELDTVADKITHLKRDEEGKAGGEPKKSEIHRQLKQVEIKRDTTLTQETPATKQARQEEASRVDYKNYHLRVAEGGVVAKHLIYSGLTGLNLNPETNESPAEKILDIYEAAKSLCEGIKNPSSDKLTQAPALIKVVAMAHYIANTHPPHPSAMTIFNASMQQLTTHERESFFQFIKTLPAYNLKFEDTDLGVSQYVTLAEPAKKSAFPGFTKEKEKQGGANDAGNYGGVYIEEASRKRALFKSEPEKEKVQGEQFTGALVRLTLQSMHSKEPDYSNQYVAKVSLETAVDVDDVKTKRFSDKKPMPADHLLYLKSEIIDNVGDFWAVALALEDENYKAIDSLPANERIKALETLAETIKTKKGNNRPTAVLKSYDHTDITVPSNFIIKYHLLEQFCEMIAVRILFGDFGVHNGNFIVIAKPSADNKNIIFKLASIDFGAGLEELTSVINPFEKKAFMKNFKLTFYKNHLLDYTPAVTHSITMAEKFIAASKLDDEALKQHVNRVITEEEAKSSFETLIALCKRMQMPTEQYKDAANKEQLLGIMRQFVYDISISRKKSLGQVGYGLLLENCFTAKDGSFDANAPLNITLLNSLIAKYDELNEFVKYRLSSYEPCRGLDKKRLEEVKSFFEKNPEVIRKRETAEKKFVELQAALQKEISDLKALQAGIKSNTINQDAFITKNYDEIYKKYLLRYSDCMETYFDFTTLSNYQIPGINLPAQTALHELDQLIQALNVKTGKKPNPVERESKFVAPKKDKSNGYVLTIGLLGTGEHRDQGATLITQLCHSIEVGKNQSVHLIDGVAAKPKDAKSAHPMLGTYDVTECIRESDGRISVTKTPKAFGACSQAAGLIKGKGTNDAIAEALLVIETMLNDKPDDGTPLTINLAGFSRGADNAVRLANAIAEKYTRKEVVVNIFALDPVPGPMRQDATKARLIPDIVDNYEAVLMRNDTRTAFKVRDKRNITVQNPNKTNVKYHIYRGVHSQGNYFYADPLAARDKAFDEELPNDVKQSEAARLVCHDLSEFAENHGIKLKEPSLNHVQYADSVDRKSIQAARLDNQAKLASYIRMMQADFDTTQKKVKDKLKDAPARDFTTHLEDYFLHGKDYFIDRTHMELVFERLFNSDQYKDHYKYVIDYYFQNGLEFATQAHFSEKTRKALEVMKEKDPDLFYSLKDYPNKPDFDSEWNASPNVRIPMKPTGIPIRVSTFYQFGNPLNKQWELLVAALNPVLSGQDLSLSMDAAKEYRTRALAILKDGKVLGSLDETELNKASSLGRLLEEINEKKIQHALRNSKSTDKSMTMINAVCSKLERRLAKQKSYPIIYQNIIQALRNAAKEIATKHLEQDHQLVNDLLNEALRAINATETEYRGGSNRFKKAIRECIIMVSAISAPARNVDQLTDAASIQTTFANHLKMKVDDVEIVDNPEFKATVTAEEGIAAPEPIVTIDAAIQDLRACTEKILEALFSASEKMAAAAKEPEAFKPSYAPRKDEPPITISDSPVHRFFYHHPHDKTTPVVNPFAPPKFGL